MTSPRLRSTAPLLESLPPAMHDEILSRLPIRDAARTSVLSRAWRRRCEPVPYRFLDWPLGVPADTVDGVLAHCTYPVREFRHPRVPVPDFGRSDHWFLRLAAAGVRSISVQLDIIAIERNLLHIHMIHSCIFSCRELVTLNIVGCDIPAPPACFVGLPGLTTLSLSRVSFPQGVSGLETLISLSPSLRTLQLERVHIPTVEVDGDEVYEQWVINAPNLQRLRIISICDYGWQFSDLPFLEVADMSGLAYEYYPGDPDFLVFISALDQARKLKLSMPFRWDVALEGLSPSFENLKSLSLQTQFCYPASILSILCVVGNASKLEVLDIEVLKYTLMPGEIEMNFIYSQCADDLFSNLTKFGMKDAMCEYNEMLFINLVLSKASQLEAFDVCLSRDCSKSVEDVLVEVTLYGRASPGANVIVRNQQNAP
ncbi:unnamed protein product [Alopecurus aequalis]